MNIGTILPPDEGAAMMRLRAITKDVAVGLGIAAGDDAVVIIKSTEVMIAQPDH